MNLQFIRQKVLQWAGIQILSNQMYSNLNKKAFPSSIDLCHRFKVHISSVLHIGSHSGDEASLYWENGIRKVVFVEASTSTFQRLKIHLRKFPGYTGINQCLSDKVGRTSFYISSNDGASSSILKPRRHSTERPDIVFAKALPIETTTLDSLNLGNFDLVVVDVQGAEGLVINGGKETINSAKALFLECNIGNMYEGDISLFELIDLLRNTFDLVYVDMSHNYWGDCFFVKKDSQSRSGTEFDVGG